jgi:hypothetical protein
MTRWNTKDLTGRLIQQSSQAKADQWEVVEFPAIMPTGNPVWPEFWKLEELEGVKASLTVQKWNAQLDAKSNIRRRRVDQERMVEKLDKRNPTPSSYHSIL